MYMHTYAHTYIHTYIHTYRYIYIYYRDFAEFINDIPFDKLNAE